MSQPTVGDIKQALQNLPQGIEGLDKTYEQAIARIDGQYKKYQELAKKILYWIAYAKRALSITEIQHALAVKIDTMKLDDDFLPEVEILGSVCAGLVIVDEKCDIIRLVHYTTQEYLRRTSLFPSAETDITAICVTYLSFDTFATGLCQMDEEFEARLQLNPLYDYATRNWGYHARRASTGAEHLIVKFLKDGDKVSASSQAIMASKLYPGDSGYSQRVPRRITGVHIAAYFGLRKALTTLLKNGHSPDPKDSNRRTPLSWAAANGHKNVVELLLDHNGVDLNSKDKYDLTPLGWAAQNGHKRSWRCFSAGTASIWILKIYMAKHHCIWR